MIRNVHKPTSHPSFPCTGEWTPVHYIIVLHTPIQSVGSHPIPPQSSVPGKVSQDDVRLAPGLPVRPASCCFGSSSSILQNPTGEFRPSGGRGQWADQLGWFTESPSSSSNYADLPIEYIPSPPLSIPFEER